MWAALFSFLVFSELTKRPGKCFHPFLPMRTGSKAIENVAGCSFASAEPSERVCSRVIEAESVRECDDLQGTDSKQVHHYHSRPHIIYILLMLYTSRLQGLYCTAPTHTIPLLVVLHLHITQLIPPPSTSQTPSPYQIPHFLPPDPPTGY